MSNKHRVVIIVIMSVIMLGIFLALIMPVLRQNSQIRFMIEEQKQANSSLTERINQLLGIKEKFTMLYAQYQKYSVELPSKSDIQVLTNEIYNIAQFAEVEIQSIRYNEVVLKDQEQTPAIDINIAITGEYYNLLVFTQTLESMPRTITLESTELSLAGEGYPEMIALINGKTYYQLNP